MELHLIDLIMLYKTLSFQIMLVALKKQVAMIWNAYQGQDYRGSQHLMASLLQLNSVNKYILLEHVQTSDETTVLANILTVAPGTLSRESC